MLKAFKHLGLDLLMVCGETFTYLFTTPSLSRYKKVFIEFNTKTGPLETIIFAR